MPVPPLVAVPLKPFTKSKERLATAFDPDIRATLSREMAVRVIETIDRSGATPLTVVSDRDTQRWADRIGVRSVPDGGAGLDAAAHVAAQKATSAGVPWAICHADLPLLTVADVEAGLDALDSGRPVLAPSSDGGTSLLGWHGRVRFSYGPGSFHRHLRSLSRFDPVVLVRTGYLLDIDQPDDIEAAGRHPRGRWLTTMFHRAHAS